MLLPLLEKLTSGKTAQLISPNYSDLNDPRPIFDWQQVIRKKGVVYVGLDALSDPEVAAAVGNSMFADLVSVAGYIYKFGINDGLPQQSGGNTPISLHCDEFSELMGDEFIPLINKGAARGSRSRPTPKRCRISRRKSVTPPKRRRWWVTSIVWLCCGSAIRKPLSY